MSKSKSSRATQSGATNSKYNFTRYGARGGASATTASLNASTLRLALPAKRVEGYRSAELFYDAKSRVIKLALSAEAYGDGRLAIHPSQHFVSLARLREILGGYAQIWDIVEGGKKSELILVARDFKPAKSAKASAKASAKPAEASAKASAKPAEASAKPAEASEPATARK